MINTRDLNIQMIATVATRLGNLSKKWGQVLKYKHFTRPSLQKIFKEQQTKTQRNKNICHAHVAHGYPLKEIARETEGKK
jgi:hypothetical protein